MSDALLYSDTFNENQDCVGIILAAGLGKRMKTTLPKVAHTALGKPLVLWAIQSLLSAGVRKIVVVLSPFQNQVEEIIRTFSTVNGLNIEIAYQNEPKGTGHAAACGLPSARKLLEEKKTPVQDAQIIIGFGDTPGVSGESFVGYLKFHRAHKNAFTLLAFEPVSNEGYGRVLVNSGSEFLAIREEKDCSAEERRIKLCNSGFLCAQFIDAAEFLPKIKNINAAGEYYLTDLPLLGLQADRPIGIYSGISESELMGVNSQHQLAQTVSFLQRRVIHFWQQQGVQFLNPDQVYLEESVTFESDVVVEPFVFLAGFSHFKKGTRIPSFSVINNGKKGS